MDAITQAATREHLIDALERARGIHDEAGREIICRYIESAIQTVEMVAACDVLYEGADA